MKSSFVSIIKRTYTEWSSHNAMRLAAAMAFYTMMSLSPLLVVALTVLTFFYRGSASGKILDRANMLVGEQGGQAVGQMLDVASKHHSGGLTAAVLSFAIALVSASGLFISLQDAINTIWDVKLRPDAGWRAVVWSRLVSVGILFCAGLVLVASLIASTVLAAIVHRLPSWLSWVSMLGEILVSFGVITLLFAIIFKFLPDVKIDWKDVWLGSALTAFLFLAGKYGLTLYFHFASVNGPFGAAGSLAALLIWVYYSATLIFFGAEFTRVFADLTGKPVEPNAYAMNLETADRAKLGEPHPDEIASAAGSRKKLNSIGGQPYPRPDPVILYSASPITSSRGVLVGAGLVLGGLIGGVAAVLYSSEERQLRSRARVLGLADRLEAAEHPIRRAAHMRDLLQRMSVNGRIDQVMSEIRNIR